MLADFFTKPLQGALFTKFRDVLLGYRHIDTLALDPAPALEERVGGVVKRANGRGTHGPAAEVTGVSWADIVKKGAVTDSGQANRPTKNVVSGDHSLETIPLAK